MSWKNINGKSYYYRSRREGKQVVSEYMGRGASAELLAQMDSYERQQTDMRRKAWKELCRRDAVLDKLVDDVGTQVGALVEVVLLTTGHHTHKRQWRKKRDTTE